MSISSFNFISANGPNHELSIELTNQTCHYSNTHPHLKITYFS